MGFWNQEVERSELAAGDHIYTWRTAFIYSHHGIYVGTNLVVHFINPNQNSSSFFSKSNTNFPKTCSNPGCNFGKDNKGSGVTIYCLDCFLENGSLCRYQYGVSWVTSKTKLRKGTCTTTISDPEDVVVKRAMRLLEHGYGDYNVVMQNCEDFALYCKTGGKLGADSGQVTFVMPPHIGKLVSLAKFGFNKIRNK